MSRTLVTIPHPNPAAAGPIINDILTRNGYSLVDYQNGKVWKMGTGIMTAMHYIKVDYYDTYINLYGWVCVGVGSLAGKERDLNGFTAIVPKRSVKKVMDQIQSSIRY